jgi:hypothetical protein
MRLHAHGWRRRTSWAEIDDAVAEVVLVGHVVVERHGVDAELLPELAHGERLEPAFVGEPHGSTQHAVPTQRDTGLGARIGFRRHLDQLLCSKRTR